jgi:ABC-type nitrate/sulfonate/bicarbonate transport system substrate-binding protein
MKVLSVLKSILAMIIAAQFCVACTQNETKTESATTISASNSTSNSTSTSNSASTSTSNHLTKVRFGMLPYGDHTYAIIGVKKGWFKEVGIDLDYQLLKVEDVVPFLKNGTVDVASCPPGILMASYENSPNVVAFCFGDLFQGFAIMAKPSYKSYSDFIKEGKQPKEAVKAAVAQMRGKTFAYPSEAAIKPFIDLAIEKSGMTRTDFKSLVLDDPMTINSLRNGQADFQVGGAPSHVILQREGFKPILSSLELALTAKPSPDSPELASILEDGWVTTREYLKEHPDIIERMASVNFRIMRFIHDHKDEALALHMPYLSEATGQKFTPAEGKIIYDDLDPFFTFEQQKEWFDSPTSLYYFKNVNGAILNSYIKQGIYQHKPPTVEDVITADQLYKTMNEQKHQYDDALRTMKEMPAKANAQEKLDKAKKYYDAYDYLDATNLVKEAIQ